jgi:hypothetical protein
MTWCRIQTLRLYSVDSHLMTWCRIQKPRPNSGQGPYREVRGPAVEVVVTRLKRLEEHARHALPTGEARVRAAIRLLLVVLRTLRYSKSIQAHHSDDRLRLRPRL